MGFTDAISALNQLKKRHVIRDYVIIGAVAAAAYLEARSTADLDVIILADTDEEYIRTFGLIAQQSEGQEGMHLILEGVPVQVFPTANMPLYQDTLDWGRVIRSGSMRTKVATPEHLILLGLLANREDDHGRIRHLLRISDFERLTGLLERFDDEQETLPPDSKTFVEQAFREKEIWHRRQARISFKHKLEVMERLRQQRLLLKSARFIG